MSTPVTSSSSLEVQTQQNPQTRSKTTQTPPQTPQTTVPEVLNATSTVQKDNQTAQTTIQGPAKNISGTNMTIHAPIIHNDNVSNIPTTSTQLFAQNSPNGPKKILPTVWNLPSCIISVCSFNELIEKKQNGAGYKFSKPMKRDQVLIRFLAKKAKSLWKPPAYNDLTMEEFNALVKNMPYIISQLRIKEMFKLQLIPNGTQFVTSSQVYSGAGHLIQTMSINRHYIDKESTQYKFGSANCLFTMSDIIQFQAIVSEIENAAITLNASMIRDYEVSHHFENVENLVFMADQNSDATPDAAKIPNVPVSDAKAGPDIVADAVTPAVVPYSSSSSDDDYDEPEVSSSGHDEKPVIDNQSGYDIPPSKEHKTKKAEYYVIRVETQPEKNIDIPDEVISVDNDIEDSGKTRLDKDIPVAEEVIIIDNEDVVNSASSHGPAPPPRKQPRLDIELTPAPSLRTRRGTPENVKRKLQF